ncbi:hypothetical protein [Methanosarcina barkeri]|nr:hypothetical protein [Methanosarcina barkeri]
MLDLGHAVLAEITNKSINDVHFVRLKLHIVLAGFVLKKDIINIL